ncbi:hypothetical protein F4861DRAFT_523662 [Xylaria intraflava]|nr:hypothetical protein F4861DRAFT_523662 [Xylaria intraflava]
MCPHNAGYVDCYGVCQVCRAFGVYGTNSGPDPGEEHHMPLAAQDISGYRFPPYQMSTAANQYVIHGQPPAARPHLPPVATATSPLAWSYHGAFVITPGLHNGRNLDSQPQQLLSSTATQSTRPSGSPKFHKCRECPQSFSSKKDLQRHCGSVHRKPGDPLFHCRCGYESCRGDNYRRHLGKCKRKLIHSQYVCKCSYGCMAKEDHGLHIQGCRHSVGKPELS